MKSTELFKLNEDYSEYRDSRWVHYSNHEMLTIKLKAGHSDPNGIYFFPEDHNPQAAMWHDKRYKFIVTLKPDARVLDLPKMNDRELERLMRSGDVYDKFHAYITQYPPENQAKKVDMAWEQVTGSFQTGRWNVILRQMGYDAVFDDVKIIHHSEPIQLLVLNPRVINIISREKPKPNLFAKMHRVIDELVAICEPFGEVTVQEPRKQRQTFSYQQALSARVEVKKSEENYANFNVSVRSKIDFDKVEKHSIEVSLSWSNPRLNYGVGATFEVGSNRWQFDGLKSVERDLQKIFHSMVF